MNRTAAEAADALNVPLPYLAKLLEAGELKLASPGVIDGESLKSFKTRRDAMRAAALDELLAADADLL
jgi:hypothetical protein